MNIFGGRPGFAAGITAIFAVLAALFFENLELHLTELLFVLPILLLCVCIMLCIGKRISAYRLLTVFIVCIVFWVSLGRTFAWLRIDMPRAESFCGENKYVHATVLERRGSTDYYTSYVLRLHSVDDEECDFKASIVCNYSSDLQKGYEFVLKDANITYVPDSGEEDIADLISEDILLLIETHDPGDSAILSEDNLGFFDRLDSLNSYLSAKLKNEIKGEEGALAAAMLLGGRSELTNRMYRDFSRSGLSHYLAVSGLHVSVITGMVSFLLLKLKMRRSFRNIFLGLFALGYLALLGFPVSAVRSVSMLMIVFIAYSMGDNADPLNSLGIAAAMIVIISPVAVFDESFILSFCSTLGIVAFIPLLRSLVESVFKSRKSDDEDKRKNSKAVFWLSLLKKAVYFVLGTLLTTAAALTLTLLPTAYLFGEVSLLGFRSNFSAVFAGAPLLISSLLLLLIGWIPFVGEGLVYIIRFCAGYFLDLAYRLGDERGALLSLVTDEAKLIVCIFSILIYILLVIKLKNKKPLLAVPASYPLVVLAIMLTVSAFRPDSTELTVISNGKNEGLYAVCGESAVLADISDGAYSRFTDLALEARLSGYTEFDSLILTHYHTRHLSSVPRIVSAEKIRRVILPYPQNEDDAWILKGLCAALNDLGCDYDILPRGGEVCLPGGAVMKLSDIVRIERSEHPLISFSITSGVETVTYIGRSAWEASSDPPIGGTVLFGSHGPVVKTEIEIAGPNTQKWVLFDGSLLEFLPSFVFDREVIMLPAKWEYSFSQLEE